MINSPGDAAELAEQLRQRNTEHATEFYILVTEDEALDLASGYVPNGVKALAKLLLDTEEDDRRRSSRPVKKSRRKLA